MKPDFCLETYKDLCLSFFENRYSVFTVGDFTAEPDMGRPGRRVMLRHDVDRRPHQALAMARLENELGIRSTYYFRKIPSVFKPDLIQEVARLGHEIGYHYEAMIKARGNVDKALQVFEQELEAFRRIAEVTTACMHGSPFWPWDNRSMWKEHDFGQFGILAEPYLSVPHDKVTYLTDTGRSWNPRKYKIRDNVEGSALDAKCETTFDLIEFLAMNELPLQILVHPERWSYDTPTRIVSVSHDFGVNAAKYMFIKLKSLLPTR